MKDQILAALKAGDVLPARGLAQRWAAEAPSLDSQLMLAITCHRAGDVDAALAALDAAIATYPEEAQLHLLRGQISLGSGQVAEGRQAVAQALSLDPNQLTGYVLLGHLAMARGDLPDAKEQLARARRLDAEHPQVLILEAQVAEAERQGDRVLPLLTRAVESAPQDALAQTTLGLAFLSRGHFAFAEAALRKALALSGNGVSLRLALVVALEKQQQWRQALKELEQLPDVGSNPMHRLHRAALLAQAGDGEAAVRACEALLEDHPTHGTAVDLVVDVLAGTGDQSVASRWLEAAMQRLPANTSVWQWRLRLGPPEVVPAVLQRWSAVAEGDPALDEARALFAESEGRFDDALAFAERAATARPQLAAAQDLRIRVALARDPGAAVTLLDGLLAQRPLVLPTPTLHGWLALAHDRLDKPEMAARHWMQAWRESPRGLSFLPRPVPADGVTASEASLSGDLLWGLPGSGVEWLAQWIGERGGPAVAVDRLQGEARGDGFGRLRPAPGHPEAGSPERWLKGLGTLDTRGPIVDWLPHWDGWTQATLAGTRLIACVRDPRDLLLAWLAGNVPMDYRFPGVQMATEWMVAVLDQLLDARERFAGSVHMVHMDQVATSPDDPLQKLARVLGVPPAGPLGQVIVTPPDGRWRVYAGVLAPAFARLQDVAVRLGYPAD